jgi:hypothetical protein
MADPRAALYAPPFIDKLMANSASSFVVYPINANGKNEMNPIRVIIL